MINLLIEFEKRYFGNPAVTEEICEDIARTFNLDPEFVKDYVYINRYEKIGDEPEEENEL
jgi:hypothetical protein